VPDASGASKNPSAKNSAPQSPTPKLVSQEATNPTRPTVKSATATPTMPKYSISNTIQPKSHDPTTVNRQGGDRGTQYRSAIFWHDEEQKKVAEEVLNKVKVAYGSTGVATTLEEFKEFYVAEDYHQDYLTVNPHGYECSTHFERSWEKIAAEFGGAVPSL
ncbi:Peptide-methionine (S)-S-oxide reductase, partial [Blyttiomyces sp. JEL0837]